MSWVALGSAAITGGATIGAAALSRRGGGGGGGGGQTFNVDFLPPILRGDQERDIVERLLSFNDTPGRPLGSASRNTLMERISPNYVPQFFRNEVLNPFLSAQFRLGPEQLGRDITRTEEQFQRLGAFFSPDLVDFTQRLGERQNLAEQDFLGNLGFRGAEFAENLRTDAIARALGLEQVTGSVLDQLLGRLNERERAQLGFLAGISGSEGTDTTNETNPFGMIAGLLNGVLGNRGGGQQGGQTGNAFDFFNRTTGSSPFDALGSVFGLPELAFQTFKKSLFPGGGT